MNILLVDDEPTILDISVLFLKKYCGGTIQAVRSAYMALSLLEESRYNVIVSDYEMPDMDGILFLKTLRSKGDDTPFIVFTGRLRGEIAIEALNNGASFYLQKGGDPTAQYCELSHMVYQVVNRRKAEMELRESGQFLIIHISSSVF
jgi:DNA-binding NtrC family response regulator